MALQSHCTDVPIQSYPKVALEASVLSTSSCFCIVEGNRVQDAHDSSIGWWLVLCPQILCCQPNFWQVYTQLVNTPSSVS